MLTGLLSVFLGLDGLDQIEDFGDTGAGDEDEPGGEPTPEEEAEILGEDAPPAKPEEKPPEDQGTPPEKKPEEGGEKKPGEDTPPAVKFDEVQTAEVNRIVSDRLKRDRDSRAGETNKLMEDNERLRGIVNRVAEGKTTEGQPAGLPESKVPKSPDEVEDVGKFLNDPTYEGWSMAKMREAHPEHYELCKTRVMNKIDNDQRWETYDKQVKVEREETAYVETLDGQLKEVKKLLGDNVGDYFWSNGKHNEKFQEEVVSWGVSQGIYDPLLAFKLKDREEGGIKTHFLSQKELDGKLATAREEGAKGLIEHTRGKGDQPPRVPSEESGQKPTQTFDSMSDDDLMTLYSDEQPGWKDARKHLIKRNLL